MDLDPDIFKKLLETFKPELEEKLQDITECLLALEKSPNDEHRTHFIDKIFRAAHNIKGTARGIGIQAVGNIAHELESLFVKIKNGETALSANTINISLKSVDNIRLAMQTFLENQSTGLKQESTPETEIKDINTIRIPIAQLDKISALMEIFQINKIAIEDHYRELSKISSKVKAFNHGFDQLNRLLNLQSLNENIRKIFDATHDRNAEISHEMTQLQHHMHARVNELTTLADTLLDEIRTLRLIPASVLLRTLPRTVRDIAQELNKSVNFTIINDSVKLDKLVLEGLKDPLIHLLRNAIDHGIEDTNTRRMQNKSETADIRIEVIDEGNHITFQISDDGSGIDTNKIAAIAVKKKFITSTDLEKLSPNQILDFIFKPGFSTKEIITDVSGRGIGLDVVRQNLINLKGEVKVKTELNKGTTISLSVPLTLASERGLLVKCATQLFVLPTRLIERFISVATDNIQSVSGNQAILFNEQTIPLRRLSDLMGIESNPIKKSHHSIIITKKDHDCIGLMVDDIINEREIVIKPFFAPLNSIPFLMGGTLDSNGQVIIVLNVDDIINEALKSSQQPLIALESAKDKSPIRPRILVVDDSITTRTLEKNILESKDYHVTIAVNGQEAWELLQKETFSLLITDISMPIMDGFTLTEHVKKDTKLRDLPVIIVTSLDSEAEKKRGIEVGADAYIVKNAFESTELLAIVEQLI